MVINARAQQCDHARRIAPLALVGTTTNTPLSTSPLLVVVVITYSSIIRMRRFAPLLFKSSLIARMSTSTIPSALAPVQGRITTKLGTLNPVHLEVINESYKHKVPQGSETHFKVVVVSEAFQDKPLLDRHSIVCFFEFELVRVSVNHILTLIRNGKRVAQRRACHSCACFEYPCKNTKAVGRITRSCKHTRMYKASTCTNEVNMYSISIMNEQYVGVICDDT